MNASADWRLPPGVSRAVWELAQDSAAADGYDAALTGTPLLHADLTFVRRHLPAASRVIDLGCGTGRAAIELATEGHRVVGVDISRPMLRAARAKVDHSSIVWAQANIVDLGALANATFTAAICLFSTLGMVAGADARQRVVAEAWRLLEPGGLFVLHVHHVGHHLGTRAGRRLWIADRCKRLLRLPDTGDFPMPAANGLPGWVIHLFSRREVLHLLRVAGFHVCSVESIGIDGHAVNWTGRFRAYGVLIAARKPGPAGRIPAGKLS